MQMTSTACAPLVLLFFFFKQKTAYEIPLCDWSSDVCSSDLDRVGERAGAVAARILEQHLRDLDELLFGRAAHLLHHLRGVASEVPLQDLEHAVRVLERGVPFGGPWLERPHEVVERRAGTLR